MDPITMVKDDHRRVKKLFQRFEKLGAKASKAKRIVVARLINELDIHAFMEEQVLYPMVRQWVPDIEEDVLQAYEEHHLVKRTLRELETMEPEDEMYDAKVCVLGESVAHHIDEEEKKVLPRLKKTLGTDELSALADRLATARKSLKESGGRAAA